MSVITGSIGTSHSLIRAFPRLKRTVSGMIAPKEAQKAHFAKVKRGDTFH